MPPSLPLVVAVFAAPAAEVPTELRAVAPDARAPKWLAPPRKDRAVVLSPGLKIHPFRPSLSARPELHQPFGIVHGGAYCSVVETLASIGAALWYGDRGKVVGVSNTTDFYRAMSEGSLTSTATPVHRGRSSQVWVVETEDGDGRLVARGQVRLHNLESPAS